MKKWHILTMIAALLILSSMLLQTKMEPNRSLKDASTVSQSTTVAKISDGPNTAANQATSFPTTPVPKNIDGAEIVSKIKPEKNKDLEAAYVEVFSGLDTKTWYYGNVEPAVKELLQKRIREQGRALLERRTTRLLELKYRQILLFHEGQRQQELREIYSNTDLAEISFSKGVRVDPSLLETGPLDTPICTINFNRKKQKDEVAIDAAFFVGETSIATTPSGTRGVKIKSLKDPEIESEFWIHSIDCFVRESAPSEERFLKLAVIHLVATLGIDVRML